jgi:hypothetical protein
MDEEGKYRSVLTARAPKKEGLLCLLLVVVIMVLLVESEMQERRMQRNPAKPKSSIHHEKRASNIGSGTTLRWILPFIPSSYSSHSTVTSSRRIKNPLI